MFNGNVEGYEVAEYTKSRDIRSIKPYTIVRKYVGFVHVIEPTVTEDSGDRSISASISNNEGMACSIVSFNDDVEKFISNVRAGKILSFENLIAVPPLHQLAIFYGTIELMPFDLVLGKDAIIRQYDDVDSRSDIRIVFESE